MKKSMTTVVCALALILAISTVTAFADITISTLSPATKYTSDETNTLTLQDANAFVSNAPTAATIAAAPVTWDFAVLRGISNPSEIPTTGYFEYGIDTNYGATSLLYNLGNGASDVNLTITSPQLLPEFEYHYRFVAYNVIGINYGADETIITPASPVATPAILFQPLDVNSGVAASQLDSTQPFDARGADDFMLANSTTSVGVVRWWMAEWNGAPPYVSPSSFNIYIYTNYPGGAGCYPTNVIQTYNIPIADCNEELFDIGTATYGYRARLEPPFVPESNMHYWISIQPVLDFAPQAGLKLAATDVNLCTAMQVFALAGLPDWTALGSESDIAFILYPYTELPPVMVTNNYGWEDYGTVLGKYGSNLTNENVTSGYDSNWPGTVTPRTGNRMLQLTEHPHASTPQAYIAWVTNLVDGDEVTASFYAWESTDGASPSMRVWGHYSTSSDIYEYKGSASGMTSYTTGTGEWSLATYTWTFDSDSGARDSLVIEARLYSSPSTSPTNSTDFWVDDLQTITPESATVIFPIPEPGIFMVLIAGLLLLSNYQFYLI